MSDNQVSPTHVATEANLAVGRNLAVQISADNDRYTQPRFEQRFSHLFIDL